MPGWQKLRLALIIIVDGVLIAHQQTPRPTLKESFLKTITCMKPPDFVPSKCEDPIGTLVQLLRQESFRLRGFPLALQLLAYQAVSKLQSTIPIPVDSMTITDLSVPHLPLYPAPSMSDILSVEADPDLEVTSLIPIQRQSQPGWGIWPDVSNDDRVSYMEELLADHRPFKKVNWHGGDTSQPIITSHTDEDEPIVSAKASKAKAPRQKTPQSKHVPKDVFKPRKTLNKTSTARKQKRISSYFPVAASSSTSNEKIMELLSAISEQNAKLSDQVSNLQKESAQLRKMLKRKITPSRVNRSSFHTRNLLSKKRLQAHVGCQTEPVNLSNDDLSHQTSLLPMDEDHILSHSPVVSQYEAQRFRDTTEPPAVSVHLQHLPLLVVLLLLSTMLVTTLTAPYCTTSYSTAKKSSNPLVLTPFLRASPSMTHLQTKRRRDTSPNKSSDSLQGFVGHATAINAFSATATSSPLSVSKTILHVLQDLATADSEIVELSDGSPARARPRHMPSLDENHLARELYRCENVPASDLISPLPQIHWDLFLCYRFHVTPSKFDFSNNFLLQLAEPTQWTTTYHIEILIHIHMLGARHSRLLEEQKLAFITPHLASGIQAITKSFNRCRKRESFQWDKQLTDLVLQPGRKWMEDVFTVYTPMIWADKHWVGLAINLDLGCIEILDPFPTLYSDRCVARFMAPVVKALPFLVKKVTNYQPTQFRGIEPFSWHRIPDLYINERGGDCGPVTVKFLEMHAHGDPAPHMSSITDRIVDDIRKQYVLDIYKTIVLPAYYKPPKP
ncbi:hypothetical protein N665_2093s0002 [Sinapis alba]|nr:hypothetical protein N665_2093s0002 [Sinapis alba]